MTGSFRRLRSVRVRTTIAASLVVGLALVVASVALVVLLGRALAANVRDASISRAGSIAASIEAGRTADLDVGEPADEFVQVIDPARSVVSSSTNVAGMPALASLRSGEDARIAGVPLEGGSFLVVAIGAAAAGDTVTVLVGRSLDDVAEATSATVSLLAVGVPVLVLVVGSVTWWITGRALGPVESIRAEVESISAIDLHRRVPEPETGDEVARLATTMNRMLSRLETSQKRQRRFVSDAAHELRSPVASIRQHVEVAIEHPDHASLDDLAEVVHRENLRVEHLVDDLLLLARLDEAASRVEEQVDLDDLVLAEAARLGAENALTVETGGISAARVVGSPIELGRVVRNLADNAARHARSTVRFTLRDEGDRVVLTVDDDGPGIEPEDRARVFDRFVRLDDARSRDGGGAGLGLAIVRAVAQAYGGTASVGESRLGGASVEVGLPVAPAHP